MNNHYCWSLMFQPYTSFVYIDVCMFLVHTWIHINKNLIDLLLRLVFNHVINLSQWTHQLNQLVFFVTKVLVRAFRWPQWLPIYSSTHFSWTGYFFVFDYYCFNLFFIGHFFICLVSFVMSIVYFVSNI